MLICNTFNLSVHDMIFPPQKKNLFSELIDYSLHQDFETVSKQLGPNRVRDLKEIAELDDAFFNLSADEICRLIRSYLLTTDRISQIIKRAQSCHSLAAALIYQTIENHLKIKPDEMSIRRYNAQLTDLIWNITFGSIQIPRLLHRSLQKSQIEGIARHLNYVDFFHFAQTSIETRSVLHGNNQFRAVWNLVPLFRKCISKAIETTNDSCNTEGVFLNLARVACLQAKAGFIEEAKRAFPLSKMTMTQQLQIANIQIRAGLFDDAIKATDSMTETIWKDDVRKALSKGYAEAGMFDQSLTAIKKIQNYYAKDCAHKNYVKVNARKGSIDEAIKISNLIESPFCQGKAAIGICQGLLNLGSLDRAIQTAQCISLNLYKVKALCLIALHTQDTTRLNDANDMIKTIQEDNHQEEAYGCLVKTYAEIDAFDQAFEAAEKIHDTWRKSQALQSIVFAFVNEGLYENAIDTTNLIPHVFTKMKTFCSIAKSLASAGHVERAILLFNTLVRSVNSMDDKKEENTFFEDIAKAQAQSKLYEQMLQTLSFFDEKAKIIKNSRYYECSLELVEAGLIQEGLQLMEWIKDDTSQQSVVLAHAAKAQFQAGLLRDAEASFLKAITIVKPNHETYLIKIATILADLPELLNSD